MYTLPTLGTGDAKKADGAGGGGGGEGVSHSGRRAAAEMDKRGVLGKSGIVWLKRAVVGNLEVIEQSTAGKLRGSLFVEVALS